MKNAMNWLALLAVSLTAVFFLGLVARVYSRLFMLGWGML